jgi:hypothetical protein
MAPRKCELKGGLKKLASHQDAKTANMPVKKVASQYGARKRWRCTMAGSFREVLAALVDERIAQGEDPFDLFEELTREANQVFGHYNLEYELSLTKKQTD